MGSHKNIRLQAIFFDGENRQWFPQPRRAVTIDTHWLTT